MGVVATIRAALGAHRTAAAALAAALVVVIAGAGLAFTTGFVGGSGASETATPATPTPTPTPAPTIDLAFHGTFGLDEAQDFSPVAATTNGVLIPWYEASAATRHPIAVMIDDQLAARPQSGLSQADIVYQAPAEGGIPRYMAIFQTQVPAQIGPIRSCRLYYVAWAEEWKAVFVHHYGAPNALTRLAQIDGKYIYNADGMKWSRRYMERVTFRVAPHNLYSTGPKLQALAQQLGATAPFTQSPFVFTDEPPAAGRAWGGTITIPYHGNTIIYRYDWLTNTYPRAVNRQDPQTDYATKAVIAPANVIVLYMNIGLLPVNPGESVKGRLEVDFTGSGRAVVFNNGQVIEATWSKKNESAPTLLTYASGPNAGQPVPMVRGQIFIQVVPSTMGVTWAMAGGASPSPAASSSASSTS